jgi:hypothetical protein
MPASPGTDTELACSELLQAGKRTGIVVTGAVLEAAVEWKNYRIVFVTDDIPFFSDPSGVHRTFKFSRRFRVEGKPQPETLRYGNRSIHERHR